LGVEKEKTLEVLGEVEGEAFIGVSREAGGGVGLAGAVVVFENFEGEFAVSGGG
jgi:hypothetical protein